MRKFILVLALVLIPAVVHAQDCVPPPDGLVGWWPLDGGAEDIAGGNHGAADRGTEFLGGLVGGAASFDGIDDVIIIPADTSLEPASFTWEFWVYTPGQICQWSSRYCRILSRGVGQFPPDLESLEIGLVAPGGAWTPDNSLIFTSSDKMYPTPSGIVVPKDEWTHVSMTFDANTWNAEWYLNGQYVSTIRPPFGPITQVGDIHLGARRMGGSEESYRGLLDEVSLFNRPLSPGEIQAIYEAGSAGKCTAVPVAIDIKPGSDPNCFNVNGHGVIPVAILGSTEFDVSQIDAYSLTFDGMVVRVRGKRGPLCSEEDSNDDGYMDVVCHFEDDAEYWTGGDDQGTVTGFLFDGTEFEGSDSICVVP